MPLNLADMPADTRASLIKTGRKWGSEDTLGQAQDILTALDIHASKLEHYGFDVDDHQELKDCEAALIAAGVSRHMKVSDKKTTNRTLADATREAQLTRLRARTVLESAQRKLGRIAGEPAAATVRSITTVLEQTSVAGETPESLAVQLDQIGAVLADAQVVAVTAKAGGPKAVTDAAADAVTLRAASKSTAQPRGTPVETETLNLIDGVIVVLVRQARDSAETAAKELGEPALLTAFELNVLYPPTKSKKAPEPAAPPAEGAKPDGDDGAPQAKPEAPKGDGTG